MHKFKNRMLSLLLVVAMILPMMMVTAGAISYGSNIVIDPDTGVVSGSITVTESTLKHKVTVAVIADFPYLTRKQMGEAKSDFARVANGLNPASLDITATKFPCAVYTFEPAAGSGTTPYELSSMTKHRADAILETAITTLIANEGISATKGPGGGYPYKVVIHTEDNTQHTVKSFELGAVPQASSLVAAPKTLKGTYTFDEASDSASGDTINAETLKTTLSITGDTDVLINKFELVGDIGGLGSVAGFDTITAMTPKKIAGDTELVFAVGNWSDVLAINSATGSIRLTYQKDATDDTSEIGVLEIPVTLGDSTLPLLQAEAGAMSYVENTAPSEYTIAITNIGAKDTTITAATTQTGDITDYTITGDDINTSIGAGSTLNLKITPPVRGVGPYSTRITISYDGGLDEATVLLNIPVTLTVTPATVEAANLSANPANKTWTVTEGGTPTGDFNFQIKNEGTADATISKIELKDFGSASVVTGITAGATVTKNDGVAAVKVTPPTDLSTTTVGTTSGNLVITYSDVGGATGTLTIPLNLEVTAAAKEATTLSLTKSSDTYTGSDLSGTAGVKLKGSTSGNDVSHTGSWSPASVVNAGTYTYTVTDVTGNYTMPNPASVTFTIDPAPRAAVTLINVTNPTDVGGKGSFQIKDYNATNGYEYSTDGTAYSTTLFSGASIDASGVITDVKAGTYYVRISAGDANHTAGTASSATLSDPVSYSISGTIKHNGTGITATVSYNDGTHTYTSVAAVDGAYTIPNVLATTGGKLSVNGITWESAAFDVSADVSSKDFHLYDITISAGTGGSVTGTNGTYASGTTVPISATASTGYTLDKWTATGGATAPGNSATSFLVPADATGAISLTAEFTANELTFNPVTLTAGTYKTAYTANVTTATNGSGNYTYTLVGTAGTDYPSWLNLSTAGAFSGTPDALADATTFLVKVDDTTTGATKTATYTLTIGQATPTVTTPPVYKTGPHWTGDLITMVWSNTPIVDGVSGDNGLAGAWTLTNTNKNLLKGTNSYEFTFTPTDTGYEAVTSSVSIKADDKTYTIAADPTNLTFTTAKAGYTPQEMTFKVKNTGNQDADALTYSALTNFALTGEVSMLTAGDTSSAITVKPNPNLAVGKYTETLTITNTTDGKTTTATVTLSFEVEAADKPTLSGESITAKTGSEKTAADVKFTTDIAGTYYYVAQTSGAAPTATEIKAASSGIHGRGNAEVGAGNGAIAITGLTADNTYQVYIIVDNAGTLSDVTTLTHKTWYDATITIQKDGVISAAPDTLTLVGGTNPSVSGNGGNHTAVLDQDVTYKLKVGNVEVATITHAALTTTVEYFTLTVKDGKGSQSAAITGGNAVFLKGTTATVSASPATGYTGDATWTLSDSSTSVVTDNSITVNDKVTATASFAPRAITYAPGSLTFTIDTSAVNETVGKAEATGANLADFTYAVKSGALPTGLTLNGATGAIAGTPTAATAAAGVEVTITATDTVTKETRDAVWTFIVNKTALPALTWTTKTDASTVGGSEGAVTFNNYAIVSGNNIKDKDAKATIAVKSKPSGAANPTIDQATGAVTGLVAGEYVFYVVADADGSYNDSADSATLTIVDGKEYTGKVNVQVDDAVTNLSGVTVTFVDKNSASVAATGDASGLYTASTALNKDNDPYTVHVSVNRNGTAKDIATGATVNGSAGTVTAADTVKLYTVNFTAGVAHSNTYENAEFATKVAGVLSAKIGTDSILNTELAYTGETATFTVTDSEANKGEYTLDWTAVLTGSTNDSTLEYTAPKAAVTAELVQKLYAVSGTKTGAGTLGSIQATAAGVDVTDSTAPFEFSLPAGTYSFEASASGENVVTGTNPMTGIEIKADNSSAYTFNVDGPDYTMTALDTNGNDATETVTVTYGYSQPGTITVNVTNIGNRELFDLTVEGSNAAFDVSAIPANTDLAAEGGTIEVTITPKAGQSATTHTLNLTFKGQKTDGGTDDSFTASYKAELAVGKFDLSGETISISGTSPYKVGTALTATHVANAGLKPADYQVKWYRADDALGTANPADTGETGLTYTIVAADVGKHLFAKVESDSANTENEKMSNVLGAVNYADYTGIVNIKEGTTAITEAGGYTVEFRPSDGAGTTVNGTFNNGHFESATVLDSTESGYDVWVKNVANAHGTLMASGKSVSPTGVSAEVVYYPVTFTADATITNTNEVVPDALKQGDVALTAALTTGSAAVENDDCVLAGQGVTFTAGGYAVDTHDYAPAWTTAAGGSGNSANTATLTYGEAKAAVALALEQRTYSVTGNVGKGVTKVTATGASGTFSVDVANAGGAAGTVTIPGLPNDTYTITVDLEEAVLNPGGAGYDDSFAVSSANVSANGFNILALTSTYTVSFTWDAASDSYTYGYEASSVNERTLTIKNTGNSDITSFVVATSDNTNFDYDTDALVDLKGILAAGADVDIGVTLKTGRDANLSGYETTFTVSAAKIDSGVTKTSNYKATVAKKDITSAPITGVTTPENGVTDASNLEDVPTGSSGVLTWLPALVDNKFAPGTVYTATVVLTPDSNHTYPNSATGTIDGGGSGTATGGVLTLEKTFAPTKPTLTAAIAGTAFDKATATFTAAQQAAGVTTEIKYLYGKAVGETAPDAAKVIADGVTAADLTVALSNLAPDTAYVVYAVAQTTATTGSVVSGWTDLVTSTADSTWYKVVLTYTGHTESAPTFTAGGTQKNKGDVISVKQGTASVALNAAALLDHWELDTTPWVANPAVGTVPATGGGTYTAPATGNGTDGVITLTAAFVGADLTVTSNYATTGTYGAAYTGTKPTVTGGSGDYTYTLINPATRATNGLPAGLKLNADGTITGTPEAVGEYAFAVEVADKKTGATASTAAVTLTVSAAKPELKTGYADGTYYNGNPVDAALLTTGTFTAPNAKSTAKAQVLNGTWAKAEIDGEWSFKADSLTYKTGPNSYNVTFTPDAKYNGVYAVTEGTVSIYAIGKDFKLDKMDVTPDPNPATGVFGEYNTASSGNGMPTFNISVKNSGNQPAALTYAIAGDNAAKFTLSANANKTVAAGNTDNTVSVAINDANLAVGTYKTTLTVTNTSAPDGSTNKVQTAEIKFTVTPKEITSATVAGAAAPVTGGTPTKKADLSGESGAKYAVTSIVWKDANGTALGSSDTFAAGTTYTATVTLTANANHKFVSNVTDYKLGTNVASVSVTGSGQQNSIALSFTFPGTEAGAVTVAAEEVSQNAGKITAMTAVSGEAVTFHYMVLEATAQAPTAAEVRSGTLPTGVAKDYGKDGQSSTGLSEGKATWSGTINIVGLNPGVGYKVYVVAVPASGTPSAVANDGFTSYYQVNLQSSNTTAGTVSPTGPFYVKPGVATPAFSGTVKSGYQFKGWSIDANGAGTFSGGAATSSKLTGETFTPTKNTTITGTFDGKVVLATSGTVTGDEVNKGYVGANVNIYTGGKVSNDGAGGMTGNLKAKVVAKGGAFDAAEDNTKFTVTINGGADIKLEAKDGADNTTVKVNPVNGLDVGLYEARVWFYEDGVAASITEPVYVDVKFNVIPEGQVAYYPKDHSWDLYSKATTNTDWVIAVTNAITASNNYNVVDKIEATYKGTTQALDVANYTYTPGTLSGSDYLPGSLTINTAYLTTLAGGKASGDKVSFVVTLKNSTSSSTVTSTALVLTYTDTTPKLTGASVVQNTEDIGKDTVLTASVFTSNGTTPATTQVTYTWYRTTASTATGGTMVQNPAESGKNLATYTVTDSDEGYKFYVVVAGKTGEYNGTVNAMLNSSAKFTVTLTAGASGTVSPTATQFVTKGGYVEAVATPNAGYTFTGWSIKSGGGKFDNATSGGTTSPNASTKFYPTASSVLEATFAQLPTLTADKNTFNVGKDSVGPTLTYAHNDGEWSKITIAGAGIAKGSRDMGTGDFSAIPANLGEDGDYTISKTMLEALTVGGNYTITFVDKKGGSYDKSVTINVVRPQLGLTSIVINEAGNVTLGAKLTTTLTPNVTSVTYQWYVGDDGTSAGLPIVGATGKEYQTLAHGNVTVAGGAAVNLSGKYLYVVATGTGDYTGSVVQSAQKPVNELVYDFTVEIVNNDGADGEISIDNGGSFTKTSPQTVNGIVRGDGHTLIAKPNTGFVFSGWTIKSGTGAFGSINGTAGVDSETAEFYPTSSDAVVVATFQKKAPMTEVTLTLPVPVKGGTPGTTAGENSPNYRVDGNVVWNPADTTFKADQVYTATIKVVPEAGESFTANPKVNITGPTENIAVTKNSDGSLTIVVTYPKTGSDGGSSGGGGGGGGETTAFTVTYDLRDLGTTKDKTTESVVSGKKPKDVPTVTANKGLTFLGWSLKNPDKETVTKKDIKNPKSETITADTVFYAVYDGHIIGEHEHFIKGLPDGNFGPTQDITRAEVATIIARACLGGFVEGAPSNSSYPDVPGHWAQSAIDFCTSKGIFLGYDDGMFHPDTPITRQEFAAVFARMAGLKKSGDMPFNDISTAHEWALDGIYTAYVNGWVVGYADGTFKPLNNIARSEAVKIVDAYLGRGVNEAGVKDVLKDVKQWPDVPETYWAYYEIMEASNDHTYHYADEKAPPEVWTKAYIEKASWGE